MNIRLIGFDGLMGIVFGGLVEKGEIKTKERARSGFDSTCCTVLFPTRGLYSYVTYIKSGIYTS